MSLQTVAGFPANPDQGIPGSQNGTGDSSMIKWVPADDVERLVDEYDRRMQQKRAYQARRPKRYHHIIKGWDSKPFCFWDGEGPRDAGYALFGSSYGDELCKPYLSTQECLDLLLYRATETKAIHCWYGGNYDVSMILHDLSWRHFQKLKDHRYVIWQGYRIEYVPRKWFSVSNGKVSIKVFDVVSFFATNFQTAVETWEVATEDQIAFLTKNKLNRDKFLWRDIDDIKVYWKLELEFGVLLMNKLRLVFHDAGFDPKSWHGPGALARMALQRHNVKAAMAETPALVRVAARHAFAGGRFEMVRGGLIETTIYNADIRSAYPYYCLSLPNLARGKWEYVTDYQPGKFGVYHIEYHGSGNNDGDRVYPLFRRYESGEVSWPRDTEGWYWNPEAELVANDPDATFHEGWVFIEDDESDRPFSWIAEYYEKRAVLKKIGNPAEFTFKLIINSVYGQLAQRTGWDETKRKAPTYHQLEWAGYITSACRARIYKAARSIPASQLVSIDTDGIYARCPLPFSASAGLGGWELSSYGSGLFWQSGIYILSDESGNWIRGKTKTRGIPKGTYSYAEMMECYRTGKPLMMVRHNFIGFGLALNGQFDKLNTWVDEEMQYVFGGKGKRMHINWKCKERCEGNVHVFVLGLNPPGRSQYVSRPHKLPWLEPDSTAKVTHDMHVAFWSNDLDAEDEWVLAEYERE